MADLAYRRDLSPRMVTDWGAIWAGMFAYYAIWLVFGTLGLACFASAGYAGVWGYGIWAIVLNVIAFYAAGHMCGSNASISAPGQGTRHGIYLFGLANVGAIILVGILYAASSAIVAGRAQVYNTWNYAGYAWPLWVALFLGFGAAIYGARAGMAGSRHEVVRREDVEPVSIRPAA